MGYVYLVKLDFVKSTFAILSNIPEIFWVGCFSIKFLTAIFGNEKLRCLTNIPSVLLQIYVFKSQLNVSFLLEFYCFLEVPSLVLPSGLYTFINGY